MTPEARRHLRLAREELTPGDEDKRRVRKALAVGLAAAAAAGASSTEAAVAAKTVGLLGGWALRGVAGVLLLASAGTGAYWWTHRRSAPAVATAPISAPVETTAPAQPDEAALQVETPPVAPNAAASAKEPEHPRAARSADPLVNELTLLHRAQQAWRDGKAQQTLDLAQQHAATYPRSQFAMERSVLQVFALCALGRKGEARSIAAGVLERAPRSPLRTSLEESCAMK
jgi:hypothetical protein